jgi:hypothetical protein
MVRTEIARDDFHTGLRSHAKMESKSKRVRVGVSLLLFLLLLL